jgi:hypothetical protein
MKKAEAMQQTDWRDVLVYDMHNPDSETDTLESCIDDIRDYIDFDIENGITESPEYAFVDPAHPPSVGIDGEPELCDADLSHVNWTGFPMTAPPRHR